jgi:hypothetical protein
LFEKQAHVVSPDIIAKRKLEENEKIKQDEMKVAAADALAQLQRALASASVPQLTKAIATVDAAIAVHPWLCVVHPQVAALRTQARALVAADARMDGDDGDIDGADAVAAPSAASATRDDDVDDEFAVYGPAMPPAGTADGADSASAAGSGSGNSSNSLLNMVARVVDTDASVFETGLAAINGIATAEPLSFVDAVKRCGVKNIRSNMAVAAKHGTTMKNHGEGGDLTADQIAAIHMYTQACDFYRSLNSCLRARDRERVKPFLSYLRLLLEGLRQLPAIESFVYRGVKLDLSDKFKKDDEPVWWSVTSTSETIGVLESKDFCGQDGSRTVFMVEAKHARNIAPFSAFKSEKELILLPGAQLRVKSVVALGGGLHMVQMEEIDMPMSLVDFEDM